MVLFETHQKFKGHFFNELLVSFNNIHLSDCNVNNSDSQIHAFFGADHYDFMTGDVKRGSEGSVAIKTILVWVLNGTFQS